LQEKIREELQNILKNDPTNYSKILELSNQLAKFDKDNVRFSVDAGIIDRLGKELGARHETAVSELIKNAYDADATKVTITFKEAIVRLPAASTISKVTFVIPKGNFFVGYRHFIGCH
jgi:hypothetical protein